MVGVESDEGAPESFNPPGIPPPPGWISHVTVPPSPRPPLGLRMILPPFSTRLRITISPAIGETAESIRSLIAVAAFFEMSPALNTSSTIALSESRIAVSTVSASDPRLAASLPDKVLVMGAGLITIGTVRGRGLIVASRWFSGRSRILRQYLGQTESTGQTETGDPGQNVSASDEQRSTRQPPVPIPVIGRNLTILIGRHSCSFQPRELVPGVTHRPQANSFVVRRLRRGTYAPRMPRPYASHMNVD